MDLLIIGHGSKSNRWNREIINFVVDMKRAKSKKIPIQEIKHCFLEHQSPSIPEAIKQHQSDSPLMLLPLFLSVSEHMINDIPQEINQLCTYEKQISPQLELYHHGNKPVLLLQPPPTPELIAMNVAKRFKQWNKPNAAALLVYYGSKKYEHSWEILGTETSDEIQKLLPAIHNEFEFGGDMVDFSPRPLTTKLNSMLSNHDEVLLIPALISVGVIQNDVIPKAIEQCQAKELVHYQKDSILPDPQLAETLLNYAGQNLQTF